MKDKGSFVSKRHLFKSPKITGVKCKALRKQLFDDLIDTYNEVFIQKQRFPSILNIKLCQKKMRPNLQLKKPTVKTGRRTLKVDFESRFLVTC